MVAVSGALRHPLRTAGRLLSFLAVTGAGIAEHVWRLRTTGRGEDPVECAAWLQAVSRRILSRIGVRSEHEGTPPGSGLVVCNHLSYLDIPVIASAAPTVFVSKAEVRRWPYIGTLARCGGTLFVKRQARGHVAEVGAAFRGIIDRGTVITVFAEGTSSGGATVLPFRSSLLEPAVANGWMVTPACITYEVSDGIVAEEVAYWREMVFAPHFLNLLSKRWIIGRVRYGDPVRGVQDRKELARRLHDAVSRLKEADPVPASGSGTSPS